MSAEQKTNIIITSDAESKSSDPITDVDPGSFGQHLAQHEQRWEPEILQPRIISGLLALATTLACMFAALGVLVASDRRPKDSWHVQPTVPLAILSGVGAGAIRYAKGCAAPVAWWHKAMQGRTVRQLEDQWQAGRGVVGAVTTLRYGNWISWATLLTTVMIIDGAMLQRASSVALVTVDRNVTLLVPLSPEVPFGASGTVVHGSSIQGTTLANEVITSYLGNATMFAAVQGCPSGSTCSGKILGPGLNLAEECYSRTWEITNAMLHDHNAKWGYFHWIWNSTMFSKSPSSPPQLTYTNSIFEIAIDPLNYTTKITLDRVKRSLEPSGPLLQSKRHPKLMPEGVLTATGIANWGATRGTFVWRECALLPAIFEYDIEVQGGQVSVPSGFLNGRFIAFANKTAEHPAELVEGTLYPATIQFIVYALQSVWASNATADLWAGAPPGTIWQPDPGSFNAKADGYLDWKSAQVQFIDPFNDIVSSFNNVMFRMGLGSANWANLTETLDPGFNANQNITAVQSTKENIYTSDYRWFAGAAILDILAVMVILPLFWGWWNLPKHLSHNSPFDMALAFDAPFVAGINSAAGSPAVIDRLGDTHIAYGVARNAAGSRSGSLAHTLSHEDHAVAEMGFQRLEFAEKNSITQPQRGEIITI